MPVARAVDDACPTGEVPGAGFRDVSPGGVHGAAVDCIAWWRLTTGRGDGTYGPAESVNRAQMATFIANLVLRSGGSLPEASRDWFPDDAGSVHESSINRLAEARIISGRADGTYAPQAPVTRDAMAKFLVLAYEYRAQQQLPPGGDAFSDDDGNVHESNIDKAAAAGFAAGTDDGGYRPGSAVRRDQMASFTARVLDLLVEAVGASRS